MMFLQLLIACMCVPYLLYHMLLSISHHSQITVASYRDGNTVTIILDSMSQAYILTISLY